MAVATSKRGGREDEKVNMKSLISIAYILIYRLLAGTINEGHCITNKNQF
jgi:hypothetical protein